MSSAGADPAGVVDSAEATDRSERERLEAEVERLRRELEQSREEARENYRRAQESKIHLVNARHRLEQTRNSREMRVAQAITRPARLLEERRSRRRLKKLPAPSFVIVGAQKAGTRWLRYNLGLHPDIYTPEVELNYFNKRAYGNGFEWYRAQYTGWSGEPFLGEATPGYMMWQSQPEVVSGRIQEQLPDASLFAVLRDPCDRALSAFTHHARRDRIAPDTDLVEYIHSSAPEQEHFQLVAGGWYAASLEPFLRRFGERLLVFLNEDLRADAEGVYRQALAHIGVERDFVPDEIDQVRFSNAAPPDSKYRTSEGGRRSLSDDERAALYPYFAEDLDRLEQLLGRDLSHWRPRG